jgi:hypothetical protein
MARKITNVTSTTQKKWRYACRLFRINSLEVEQCDIYTWF